MTRLEDALRSLPHGPEFRFVDRILDLTPGVRAVALYVPPADAPFFRGHFPGNPTFPGVLLVEAVAQLAGIVAQSDPDRPPFPELKLTALRNVKILGAAKPGDTLVLEAAVTGRLGPLIQAEGSARVEERVVLRASLALSG